MEALLFWTLIAGLAAWAYFYSNEMNKKELNQEGFQDPTSSTSEQITLTQPNQPPWSPISDAGVQPSPAPPSSLPSAPFGNTSQDAPLPFQDPSTQKATLIQILGVLEDLRGFLGFEAKTLSTRSDPTIQLPLTQARADFQRLLDESRVLQQTPGIQSHLTQENVDTARANLRYLQVEARNLENSGAVGPAGGDGSITEESSEGFTDATAANTGPRATKDDLAELVLRIWAETKRLSASGTTDPVIQARVNTLTNIRLDVEGILNSLRAGTMAAQDVPIYKSDLQKVLPLLGQSTEPLPALIKKTGLSPALANLFPANATGTANAQATQQILSQYMDQLVQGLSWGIQLQYTSPAAVATSSMSKKQTNLVGRASQLGTSGPSINETFQSLITGVPSTSELNSTAGQNAFDPSGAGSTTRFPEMEPALPNSLYLGIGNRGPATFDWKQRAKEIRDAVRRRGLDPADFGFLPESAQVGQNFSWKGHTKSVCERLRTTTVDPSLDLVCSCPESNWGGWK